MRLAFAGLADLLGPRLDAVLPGFPAPQRRALGVALLVEDAPPVPPEPRVIAAAFRTALLLLAASAPVAAGHRRRAVAGCADGGRPSGSRCGGSTPNRSACSARSASRPGRPEPPLELDRARLDTEVLSLGGLSLGALHHLLRTRLDMSFSHPTLRRIDAESAGNPFIALEIGRALARRGITRLASGPLPVPDTLAGLVGERLRELPAPVAAALEAVAVMPGAPLSRYLAAGVPAATWTPRSLAGVLEVDAGRLRFSHPLLASAVLGRDPPGPAPRAARVRRAASAADPSRRHATRRSPPTAPSALSRPSSMTRPGWPSFAVPPPPLRSCWNSPPR